MESSIWDTYAHTHGRIADGSTGDMACDHYHRMEEDIGWLARSGVGAYRFSVAWPRVFPEGSGRMNAKGLDFYERLVDGLLAKRIDPWICLYHWDLPQALQDRGGWLSRESAPHFVDYARAVGRRLGDRVRHWAMFNEPNIHAIFGHTIGGHAPGLKGWSNFAPAVHHQNLALGLGIAALRAERARLQLGTVISMQPVHPASDTEADRAAATRFDAVWNRACLDPLLKGTIPGILRGDFAAVMQPGDLTAIRQPIDFLGINYYSRLHVRDDPGSALLGAGFRRPAGRNADNRHGLADRTRRALRATDRPARRLWQPGGLYHGEWRRLRRPAGSRWSSCATRTASPSCSGHIEAAAGADAKAPT